jgi:hypothetical protein
LRHALFLKRLKEVARLHGRTASAFRYFRYGGVGVLGALAGLFVGLALGITTFQAFGQSDLGGFLGVAVGIMAVLSLAVGPPVVLRWRDVRAAQVAAEQVAGEYRTELQPWGGASVLGDGLAVQELLRFQDKEGAGSAVPPDGPPAATGVRRQPGAGRRE